MDDTWASRDLPVLEAAVSQIDQLFKTHQYPDATDIAAITGMDILDVITALNALDGTFIKLSRSLEPSRWHITDVTPAARHEVGQWPTGESLVERLAAGISQAVEQEQDLEQKRRLLSVAHELGGAVKAIAINVASEILEHRLPH
jgi:DNA-directed RNA polymerase specialized sigma subunit